MVEGGGIECRCTVGESIEGQKGWMWIMLDDDVRMECIVLEWLKNDNPSIEEILLHSSYQL